VLAGESRGANAAPNRDGIEDARGWPYLALWCTLDPAVIEGTAAGKPCPDGIALSKLNGKITTSYFRALPVRPIWRGLAADTGIFAGAWLSGLVLAGAGRRWWRRRRGRCPACGYDLSGSSTVCPECGAAARAIRGPRRPA
jgi:hypothetical protein